ncbi:12627_t:CDS:2, partial [Gigaspora rosea]
KRLFETSSEKSSYYSENRVFIIEDVEEKLYSVALNYFMNKTKTQHLKAYDATALNKSINRQGIVINSILSNRKGDAARILPYAKLLVDRNAHYRNAPVILEMQEFFGEVYYFFSHQYDDKWSMLAYVQW